MKSVKDVFFELIDEAKDGFVTFEDKEFGLGFNTVIEDKTSYYSFVNQKELHVNDLDQLLIELSEYADVIGIPDESLLKLNMINIFANAEQEDYDHPEEYIQRLIEYEKVKDTDEIIEQKDGLSK